MHLRTGTLVLAVALAAVFAPTARATNISGAGSTFVYPVLSQWTDAYKVAAGVTISYKSIGSGGGIKAIEGKTVDFGASDAPLSPAELEKFGMLQFPVVIGGDVPIVNLPGIDAGKLVLNGTILAEMFLGKVTKWNDKALADLNPDIALPDLAIAVVFRSDVSGTTYIWTHYLSAVSPEWKDKIGFNAAVDWPTGIGAKGNEGVAAMVHHTIGAVGYVEYAYAKRYKLTYARLRNREGVAVGPDHASFQAAAANADWAKAPGLALMLTDQPGRNSWPIIGCTFVLIYKHQDRPDAGQTVLRFFDWAFLHGDHMADSLDYVPLPDKLVELVETTWRGVESSDDKPLWPVSHE